VEQYADHVRSDPTNKYVHIRDIVSQLKAYKAKPMKQVIPTMHGVGLDSDHSSESDDCAPLKRPKIEVGLKQELPVVVEETVNSCKSEASQSLPGLVRHSSVLCQFVPLTAMPCSKSADMDVSDCCVVDVLADDADSRSSFDDGGSSQPATAVNNSRVTDESINRTNVVLKSVDSTMNCSREKSSLEPSSASVQHASKLGSSSAGDQHDLAEVSELEAQTASSHSESVAECSMQQRKSTSKDGEAKSKLASARHIRYLETLLSV